MAKRHSLFNHQISPKERLPFLQRKIKSKFILIDVISSRIGQIKGGVLSKKAGGSLHRVFQKHFPFHNIPTILQANGKISLPLVVYLIFQSESILSHYELGRKGDLLAKCG